MLTHFSFLIQSQRKFYYNNIFVGMCVLDECVGMLEYLLSVAVADVRFSHENVLFGNGDVTARVEKSIF